MVTVQEELPNDLKKLVQGARVKHVPKGQIILYEGDLPTEVYIIKTGAIKVYDIDEQGNEKILHIVKSPALIPFAFFSGLRNPLKWFYAALTDCDIYILPSLKVKTAMDANAKLSMSLMNAFSSDLHELLVRLSSLSKTSAKDKVCSALKFLVVCHSRARRSGWHRINFAVSHQLMADLCGVTRESASLAMKELQDEGYIRNPRLTILEVNWSRLNPDQE